mgnify:FL=1
MTQPPVNSFQTESRAAWRRWLAENHNRGEGVWLVGHKKATGRRRLDYEAAVEEALCYGWIDSKPRRLDDLRFMLWFAPRKPRSGWSAPNKRRILRLIRAGKMAPAGLAKVEAAKQDGSWSALDAVEALKMPPDLKRALGPRSATAKNFAEFPRSAKRGILEWIMTAKRPGTRMKRIAETARLAARNVRANQWSPRVRAG